MAHIPMPTLVCDLPSRKLVPLLLGRATVEPELIKPCSYSVTLLGVISTHRETARCCVSSSNVIKRITLKVAYS